MGFKETLELIISSNIKGGVDGLEQVGAAAEKNLGKTTNHLEQLGGRFQVAGAAMVGFGAVAIAGLGGLAHAGEEAHQVDVKLAGSVEKAGEAAGGSVEPFKQLAEEMQKKVAFDDEAIKSSEAMQLQVGLTKDQVLQLTPLIADLAAKTGLNLTEATQKVTLAINGKKKGLEGLVGPLDAARYSTDRYAAVQDALNAKVGGFAEEQGKTFEGQLEILKNRLGDVAEGVGVGAVSAFEKMLGAVDVATGALEAFGPGMQSTIGEVATFGAVGLVAVGAFTSLAGTVMKSAAALKEFAVVKAASEALSNPYVALAAGIAAVAAVIYEGTQIAEQFTISAKEMATVSDGVLVEGLGALEGAMKLTGTSAADMGKMIAEQSIPQALRLADALDASGRSSDEVRVQIAAVQEQHVRNAAAADLDRQQTADMTLADQGLTQAAIDNVNAIHDQTDALKAQFDPMFAAQDSAIGLLKAQQNVTDAQGKLTEAIQTYGATSPQAVAAQDALNDAQYSGVKAAEHNELAMAALATEVQKNPALFDAAKAKLQEWVAQGAITQVQADQQTAAMGRLGSSVVNLPDGKLITVDANFSGAYLELARWKSAISQSTATLYAHFGLAPPDSTRAAGGPVRKGVPYVVGENHAEVFTPDQDGYIDPRNPASFTAGPASTPGMSTLPGAAQVIYQFDVQLTNHGVITNKAELGGWLIDAFEAGIKDGNLPGPATRAALTT